jgi:hypothetical protein
MISIREDIDVYVLFRSIVRSEFFRSILVVPTAPALLYGLYDIRGLLIADFCLK